MRPKKPRSSSTPSAEITFDIYRSEKNKKWYVRAWSKRGRIIADFGQGYERKRSAIRICELFQDHAVSSQIFVNGELLK